MWEMTSLHGVLPNTLGSKVLYFKRTQEGAIQTAEYFHMALTQKIPSIRRDNYNNFTENYEVHFNTTNGVLQRRVLTISTMADT